MLDRVRAVLAFALVVAVAAGCATGASGPAAPAATQVSTGAGATAPGRAGAALAHWTAFAHVRRPVDLAGPRADGSFVMAADGRLATLTATGVARPIDPRYRTSAGLEPYIALAPPRTCFSPGAVYTIRFGSGRGVTEVDRAGRVRRFAIVHAPGLINGIAFDTTGAFRHRLLLTVAAGARTTVLAVDCRGRVLTITRRAPRVEGGIAVAPASFGRFGADLIAPDEISGNLYAVAPTGASRLIAASAIAHGQDTGVESEAFMPAGALRDVFVADRLTPGNPHPGDDVVLRIGAAALARAGVAPGDLLVAGEGGAQTVAVHCAAVGCTVARVADGPPRAHLEGHVAVAGAPR